MSKTRTDAETQKEDAKHTPGPWETDEQCCMVFIPVRDESREGKPRYAVACATDELQPTAGFYSQFDERTPGEAKANMRLISAATDFEAACAMWILIAGINGAVLPEDLEEWAKAISAGEVRTPVEAAREAIAKIEGTN